MRVPWGKTIDCSLVSFSSFSHASASTLVSPFPHFLLLSLSLSLCHAFIPSFQGRENEIGEERKDESNVIKIGPKT